MERWVEITFDCLPLRSITRLDIPLDASPGYRAFCERLKSAISRHGTHNAYYLHHAACVYRLANHADLGRIEFQFEGTLLTDAEDLHTKACDLQVEMTRETCDWLTQPIVDWLKESVRRAVAIEFDRYIEAGDLARAKERVEKVNQACEESGGYLGMYL